MPISPSYYVGQHAVRPLNEEDEFKSRILDAKVTGHVRDKDDANPENWSAAQVKAAAEMFQRADQKTQDRIATGENGTGFVANHKEYIDSDANAELMKHELTVMFGDVLWTPQMYEEAYESLRTTKFLALNQTEDAKRQKAIAKQQYEEQRAASVEPSIESLYQMPLEDLRRLDAVENQKRMQRRGEEGGDY
jgi:hypothetical protein